MNNSFLPFKNLIIKLIVQFFLFIHIFSSSECLVVCMCVVDKRLKTWYATESYWTSKKQNFEIQYNCIVIAVCCCHCYCHCHCCYQLICIAKIALILTMDGNPWNRLKIVSLQNCENVRACIHIQIESNQIKKKIEHILLWLV